jgi:hypothetical protein
MVLTITIPLTVLLKNLSISKDTKKMKHDYLFLLNICVNLSMPFLLILWYNQVLFFFDLSKTTMFSKDGCCINLALYFMQCMVFTQKVY